MVVQTELYLSYDVAGEIVYDSLGRRRWPDEFKGRLVAQSFLPGVSVREIAERVGVRSNHLSYWRRCARGADCRDRVTSMIHPTHVHHLNVDSERLFCGKRFDGIGGALYC